MTEETQEIQQEIIEGADDQVETGDAEESTSEEVVEQDSAEGTGEEAEVISDEEKVEDTGSAEDIIATDAETAPEVTEQSAPEAAVVAATAPVVELTAEELAAPAVTFAPAAPEVPVLSVDEIASLPEVLDIKEMIDEYAENMRVGRPQTNETGKANQRYFLRLLKLALSAEGVAFGACMNLLVTAFKVHADGALSPEYRNRFLDAPGAFSKKDLDFFNSFVAIFAALATSPLIFANMNQEIVLDRVAAALGGEGGAAARSRLQEYFSGLNSAV